MRQNYKTHAFLYSALILGLLAALVFGIRKDNEAESYARDIRMDYQRCFTELVQYVDDLELNLEKSRFVNDPEQMMYLSGEIYREAMGATANLSMLPLKTRPLEHLSKFLNQVGSYTSSLSEKMLDGENITDEEYSRLGELCRYAKILAGELDGDLEELYNGTLDIRQTLADSADSPIDVAMGEIEDQLHDYPALIYDGPFSSHLTDRKPLFLEGKPDISEADAKQKGEEICGKVLGIVLEEGNVPAYYMYDETGQISVAVTKQGGYLLSYLNDRNVGDSTTDIASAKLVAATFLKSMGFEDMKESYYETINNVAVINYAATKEGYTLYPDLVKVKVALDDCTIVGFESRGYIMYHRDREIPAIKISVEAAEQKVNPHVTVLSKSLALIPREGGTEAYCWQIEGKIDDRRCLIYVNTQTGAEEKVFLLIESETGVLAV